MTVNDWGVKVWDGNNWVDKTSVYVWSGSAWVNARLYVYTGSVWQIITDHNAVALPSHTQTWNSTGHVSWQGDGTARTDSLGLANNFQGDWGDSYGLQKSGWLMPFSSIQSALGGQGGSSVDYCRMTATLRGSKLAGGATAVIGLLNAFSTGVNFNTLDLSHVGYAYIPFTANNQTLNFAVGANFGRLIRNGDDGMLCLYISEGDQTDQNCGYWDANVSLTIAWNR